MPTSEMLQLVLGDSYAAYVTFQNAVPNLDIKQIWQWYTPYKAWFARGQYWQASGKKGKEKTLYWLHVYEGYFCVAVWFKEKNRTEALKVDVSKKTKQLIRDAETMGKMPTFPVIFEITTTESLADICALINCKKAIE